MKTSRIQKVGVVSVHILVHLYCVIFHVWPVVMIENEFGGPTLDELHIMSSDNLDIHGNMTAGETSLQQIFSNDYWGRPMNSPSSHKSWRPFTVLSFRYLKGMLPLDKQMQLWVHRIFNVVTHAAVGDVCGLLAVQLFPHVSGGTSSATTTLLLHIVTKLVFVSHPTHVEVTINAANRHILLAVLCSVLLCDQHIHIYLFLLYLLCGFLVSETFVVTLPAVIVTIVIIRYQQQLYQNHTKQEDKRDDDDSDGHDNSNNNHSNNHHPLIHCILCAIQLLPRIWMILMTTALYLGGRYHFDTLDIPEGLIRPAENPFYDFQGMHRFRNYLYIVSIHFYKSLGYDPIGYSHEYGYECIPDIKTWGTDNNEDFQKLLWPLSMLTLFGGMILFVFFVLLYFMRITATADNRHALLYKQVFGYILLYISWLITLYPISGITKVGTFVADRITVASTVPVSIFVGYIVTYWITNVVFFPTACSTTTSAKQQQERQQDKIAMFFHQTGKPLQVLVVGWLCFYYSTKVFQRSLDWMDSISLLESSLKTCPNFAKGHVEISKIYSGLYDSKFDLNKSLKHLRYAYDIDPDMCDIHQQFAHVYIQQHNYLLYEEHLCEAVLCPYTMAGSVEMWKRYWQIALNQQGLVPGELAKIKRRYQKYQRKIQKAAQEQMDQ